MSAPGKLLTLGVGLVVMLCAGTPYMFGVFDSKLKQQFLLSQTASVLVETRHVSCECACTEMLIRVLLDSSLSL